MLGFHWPELIVVLVVALLIFGPKRLPEMGNALGKTIQEFRKSMSEAADHVKSELPASQPAASPLPPASATEAATTSETSTPQA
jgi:sec-independent protein translocase protein TatA